MPFSGPWVQPADVWGPTFTRGAAAQAWGTDIPAVAGATYPAGPTSTSAPNGYTNPDTSLNAAQYRGWLLDLWSGSWRWQIVEWVWSMDFRWQIDNKAVNVMPPVPPTPAELAAPHVTGYEYETPAGSPLGPLQVTLHLDGSGVEEHMVASGGSGSDLHNGENADWSEISGARLYVVPVTHGDVVWTEDPFTQALAPARWFMPADFATGRIIDAPVSPGPSPLTVSITLAAVDADGGSYQAAGAVSLYVDNTPPSIPDATTLNFATKSAGAPGTTSSFRTEGLIYYRPPRYRLLYDRPPFPPGPLRQAQRADGIVGGSPFPLRQQRRTQGLRQAQNSR